MFKKVYIFSIEKNDGTVVYIGDNNSSLRYSPLTFATHAYAAHQFPLDTPKSEITEWMGKIAENTSRHTVKPETIKVLIYESKITEIDIKEDSEWMTAFQRSGVEKLSILEIQSLGLEKYEIERRLSKDD